MKLLTMEIDKNNPNEGRILAGQYIVAKIYANKDGLSMHSIEGDDDPNECYGGKLERNGVKIIKKLQHKVFENLGTETPDKKDIVSKINEIIDIVTDLTH